MFRSDRTKRVLTLICRLFLSFIFIFSGFVKAVDPIGSQVKFNDYLSAFGWHEIFSPSLLIFAAIMLALFEFLLGVCLLFGMYRKMTAWAAFVVMALFTPFTLFLAIDNPVTDCGCFGDAWVLTNWETFAKNLFLLAASLVFWLGRKDEAPFTVSKMGWTISIYSFLFLVSVALYGINHLPLFDFRPYHVGANLPEKRLSVSPEYVTSFVMEKDGEQREFSEEDYPDSTWHFVSRRSRLVKAGKEAPLSDFSLARVDDGSEMADELLSDSVGLFLLVANNLQMTDGCCIDKINDIYDFAADAGYGFWGVTSSGDSDRARWTEQTGAEYPFLNGDEVLLKTIVRANPGLLFIKNGIVIGKWNGNDVPTPDEMQALIKRNEMLSPMSIHENQVFRRLLWLAFLFFVPLSAFKLIDSLINRRKKEIHS